MPHFHAICNEILFGAFCRIFLAPWQVKHMHMKRESQEPDLASMIWRTGRAHMGMS